MCHKEPINFINISVFKVLGVTAVGRDQAIGACLLVVSVVVIAVYIWLVFFPPVEGVDIIVLKITGAAAIAAIFGVIGWVGYTLATTPPPKPIEEIERELEEELKKLEEQEKEKGEEKKEG